MQVELKKKVTKVVELDFTDDQLTTLRKAHELLEKVQTSNEIRYDNDMMPLQKKLSKATDLISQLAFSSYVIEKESD